jgi:hypothetical protein
VAGAFVVMVLAGLAGSKWSDDALDRMRQPEQLRYVRLRLDGPSIYAMHCDDWFKNADVHPCTLGPPGASHTAVIIGDSVALQWFPAVAKIFHAPDWRLIALTKSACPMVDAPVFYDRIHRIYTECAQWREAALRHVASVRPDIVLLGSTYTYDLSPEQWTSGTDRVLKQISAASGHIHILRSTPRLPFDATTCLAPRSQLYHALASNSSCTATAHTPQNDAVYGWLSTAATAYPNVSLIDMTNAVCPHDVCSGERDGIIVFRDSQHLTTQFVASITDVLAHVLDVDLAATSSDAAGAPANPALPVPQSTP